MSGVSVKIDLEGVRNKLSPQAQDRGQHNMANRMLATMNENFVPERDGNLRKFSHVDAGNDSITWEMPYARKHYYTNFSPNYTTPGTGPKWDEKAAGIFMDDWKEAYLKGAGIK